MTTPSLPALVIGIDGGATHTAALLADAATGTVLGRGESGPSNIQAVGVEAALKELDVAVAAAFAAAARPRANVAAACLGLAGVDLAEGLDIIGGWAQRVGLADHVSVANDATLLFAAGTPEGWGLAVIAGTGSIAFTLDRDGNDGRAGGWGYLLGDEGSAWLVGLNGLRAACRAADRAGPPTRLVDDFLKRLGTTDPRDFIPATYRGVWDRSAIAGLAPLVLEAAEAGDDVAHKLVVREVTELARTAATAVDAAKLPKLGLPVAVAGGLIAGSPFYRGLFVEALRGHGIHPGAVTVVDDPAVGAVVLARKAAASR
ncbi:N-acetylglucosamine kinase [Urbifossiella limnaea]|uniref:BadF/BadG/BcrA/BcrD ATPase family protein n=1 Tax=Urbifossiella limnaea TaxID=2528023 RepID=A0A517XTQ8_9BACT|nr:BadF/BadG/BcrA/BcrD ATPase family protein [Urbifossiella limnaea]QDU20877.1 BadF/BadG/BcrA/BcrD ATPase family protein [Urbifossiella limnaea]